MKPEHARISARIRLTRLALGGWSAQVLFAANKLGVFELLARGAATADEVSVALGTDRDATERLLGALCAIDLVEHQNERFANTLAAREFLVSANPESMVTWVDLIGQWNQTFAKLDESVRSGSPAEVPEHHLGVSDDYTRKFILGMHDYALGPGQELARQLDLTGRTRLLDVGGGPGTYSVLLAAANPGLRCTVFDLHDVVRIAEEVVAARGLQDRVTTTAGDYHTDALPEGFDVVLVSNTLHQEDEASCLRILRECHRALDPGGMIVIQAMPLGERRDGPLWPALHNLLMLLVYRGGRAYTAEEYCRQLCDAGFHSPEVHAMSAFNAESFIVATRE